MSDFKAKMHEIRCWGGLQRSPDPKLYLRGATSKRRGSEVKGRGGSAPHKYFGLESPLFAGDVTGI